MNVSKTAGVAGSWIKLKNPTVVSAASITKTSSEIAKEVLAGKWGNGDERISKLKAAGYDPANVQYEVNQLLGAAKKSVTEIAKEVIAGKWGNGTERISKLKTAGYNPTEVQNEVNRLLKQ